MRGVFSGGPMLLYRFGRKLHLLGFVRLGKVVTFLNRIVFATVVPCSANIGRGTVVGYAGLGVVIHSASVIGERVHICQNVTIGRNPEREGVPVIEDDVYIGPGAVVSGNVRIGRGARIGANAVVLKDIPPGAVAVGVPARVLNAEE